MKKCIPAFFIICLFLHKINSSSVHACSCLPNGYNFCETINNDSNIASIVMVQKMADYHHGMKVKLIELITGETIADSFMVWGDNGALCRLYTSGWAVGDTLILALHHCDTSGNWIGNNSFLPGFESTSDYEISFCGIYALEVKNNNVQGQVYLNRFQSVNLQQFIALPCMHISEGDEDHEGPYWNIYPPQLYPNPAGEYIQFTISSFENAIQNITIFDIQGRVVYEQLNRIIIFPLDVNSLSAGIYTVVLFNVNNKVATFIKFVKS